MNAEWNAGRFLSLGAAILAIAAVSVSIWLNPPSEIKARTFDKERLGNLETTSNAINIYFDGRHVLPAELKILDSDEVVHRLAKWHDPVTHAPYEYKIIDKYSYQLCADFERETDQQDVQNYVFKRHKAGHDCFEYHVKKN